ncbi:M1 family metallopeptidase [Microlunatus endophyticus]|uniref:M1 family metallopeptidase n=1 Tax=Microlunatus endophyticus TaxID=1716077 RepID=UPI00166ADBB3|nr:M1 family metallopeptidase [Microlunatus endophyticus]
MSNAEPPEPTQRTFGRPPRPGAPAPSDPVVPPGPGRRIQPSTIVIIALVVIMVVGTAIVPVLTPVVDRWLDQRRPPDHSVPHDPGPPVSTGSSDRGGPGVGDPYYPDYGSSGYDARKYTINLNWAPKTQKLSGTTTIDARSDHELLSFYVDLVLPVTKITVNGRPARFDREGSYDVRIVPQRAIRAHKAFSVTVTYGGNPANHRIDNVEPWSVTGDEVTAAGEPEGSAWWYPANDHPSDPASYDVSVRVPAGLDVISNGRLVSRDTGHEKSFDTWHWVTPQTLDTYQSLLSIGHYEIEQGTAGRWPYVYAVSDNLSAADRKKAFANLELTPKIISAEENVYGPYPYDAIGGLVTGHDLWYDGLESATRPVYDARDMTHGNASSLLAHELAHMWFGDHVTLKQWNDIFISEAYASFSQWWYAEKTGGRSAASQLQRTYDQYANTPELWHISMIDPGRDHLFDAVYLRGPMTLQALRTVIGDEAFFRLARTWAQRGGVHSLEDWMKLAERISHQDLTGFFQAWIYGPTAPAKTKANGLA